MFLWTIPPRDLDFAVKTARRRQPRRKWGNDVPTIPSIGTAFGWFSSPRVAEAGAFGSGAGPSLDPQRRLAHYTADIKGTRYSRSTR